MKKLMIVTIIILLATSCATRESKVKGQGGALGAAIGAVLGGAIAKELSDCDDDRKDDNGRDDNGKDDNECDDDIMIGAVIGAAVGGKIGYSYAEKIEKRHEALAGKEDDLDTRIDFAKGVNKDTQEYNQNLEQDIAKLKPQIDNLVSQIGRNDITREQLIKEQKSLDDIIATVDRQFKVAQKELSDLRKFQSQQNSTELDQQIAALEANVEILEKNTKALASQRQRI